jgi:hypothetical protein
MSSTAFQQIAAAQSWQDRVNENFISVSPSGLYGINPALTTGLVLAYLGGNFNGVSVANNNVSLTASTTNYVVAHRTTGVVTASTTTANWVDTVTYMQLYQVVTGAATITTIDDKRQAYGAGSSSTSATPSPSLIINGRFNINQRQKSGSVVLTAGTYGHDRWKAGAAGCTYTFSTSAGVTTITISAGSLQQVIESTRVRTGTHALAWTGTAQGKIGAGSYSASGVTGSLTGGANATVEFNTGTLTDVRLNPGSSVIPYMDPGDAAELFACQRYCYRFSTVSGNTTAFQAIGVYASTTSGFVTGIFPQSMMTSPTLVVEGAAAQYTMYEPVAATYAVCTAVSSNVVTNAGFFLFNFSVASGGTAGRPVYFSTNAQLTNSIRFEAEL